MRMRKRKDYIPFHDPQQEKPVGACWVCGREVYRSDGECLYCQTYPT